MLLTWQDDKFCVYIGPFLVLHSRKVHLPKSQRLRHHQFRSDSSLPPNTAAQPGTKISSNKIVNDSNVTQSWYKSSLAVKS